MITFSDPAKLATIAVALKDKRSDLVKRIKELKEMAEITGREDEADGYIAYWDNEILKINEILIDMGVEQ